MITKAIAETCPREMWHVSLKNADGTPLRCRSNGKCQTWKTRPEDYKLPIKRGMYEHGYITPANAARWVLPADWPYTGPMEPQANKPDVLKLSGNMHTVELCELCGQSLVGGEPCGCGAQQ